MVYKVILDTLTYSKEDDSSIEHTLKVGQYICLANDYAIYKVVEINSITNDILQHEVLLEEVTGHVTLQTFDQNQNMVLHLYNKNYSQYHYVEVPLEENQFISLFISTLYNNVKSVFSEAILLNLDEISIVDKNGQKIINNGKEVIPGSIDNLEAKGITFSYDGKRDIIKDFSLDIYVRTRNL